MLGLYVRTIERMRVLRIAGEHSEGWSLPQRRVSNTLYSTLNLSQRLYADPLLLLAPPKLLEGSGERVITS